MMIAPNKTPVLATLIEKRAETHKCWLKIVLIKVLEKDKLPAFLYVGRLLDAEYHQLEIMNQVEVGQLIEGMIEVTGNPMRTGFVLHDVQVASALEEE